MVCVCVALLSAAMHASYSVDVTAGAGLPAFQVIISRVYIRMQKLYTIESHALIETVSILYNLTIILYINSIFNTAIPID